MNFIIGLIVAFGALLAAFLVVSRRDRPGFRWVGAGFLVLAVPASYWFGSFSTAFVGGQCYSVVVQRIADAVEATSNSKVLAERIRALPFRGYETVCPEVEAATLRLMDAALATPSSSLP